MKQFHIDCDNKGIFYYFENVKKMANKFSFLKAKAIVYRKLTIA